MIALALVTVVGVALGFAWGRWWSVILAVAAVPVVLKLWTLELWPPQYALFVVVAALSAGIGIQARSVFLGDNQPRT